jgi:hypothetical protein
MCTFPRPDWDFQKASGNNPKSYAYYFDECMTGFEYQVASHMINEGLIQEGLVVTRAIHDRYHPSKRNPYNEIECGDHYSRAMASYGVYLAACGFEYHGPKGHLGFSPKLTPDDFRACFTTAEGWGTFSQQLSGPGKKAEIDLKWGRLKLNSLALTLTSGRTATAVQATVDGKAAPSTFQTSEGRLTIDFTNTIILNKEQKLVLLIS